MIPDTGGMGVLYEMCGHGEALLSGVWMPDGSPGTCDPVYSNVNMATTIDRGKPTVTSVGTRISFSRPDVSVA